MTLKTIEDVHAAVDAAMKLVQPEKDLRLAEIQNKLLTVHEDTFVTRLRAEARVVWHPTVEANHFEHGEALTAFADAVEAQAEFSRYMHKKYGLTLSIRQRITKEEVSNVMAGVAKAFTPERTVSVDDYNYLLSMAKAAVDPNLTPGAHDKMVLEINALRPR